MFINKKMFSGALSRLDPYTKLAAASASLSLTLSSFISTLLQGVISQHVVDATATWHLRRSTSFRQR
ncbi:hypothetical protein IGI04_027861 [Brassica rapa subsp. trilocularis]|uniref:CASP-like protein n=1 Tax=Brassica rapa subsp. trilocularis TaxID=1813537 RepID=A0ABQ7L094_BRACM|nr:hypothetical protein IGI04_027861 [Brassica rapa subsp. trilocularis]